MENESFQVLGIDGGRQMMTITPVGLNLLGGYCPSVEWPKKIINHTLFSYSETVRNLNIFFNCSGGFTSVGADCGLQMEILGCGWSWIEEGKGKYLAVAGAGGWRSINERKGKYLVVAGAQSTKEMKEKIFGCGWSSINGGKARENTWVELHRQRLREIFGKRKRHCFCL
ncbi:hypothetical protein WN943_006005 [Citrus x changshan-huyou]